MFSAISSITNQDLESVNATDLPIFSESFLKINASFLITHVAHVVNQINEMTDETNE